MKQAKI